MRKNSVQSGCVKNCKVMATANKLRHWIRKNMFNSSWVATIKIKRWSGIPLPFRLTAKIWAQNSIYHISLIKPYLFAHPNPINAIISWIISWQTITIFLSLWYDLPTNSPTNDPTNNRIKIAFGWVKR